MDIIHFIVIFIVIVIIVLIQFYTFIGTKNKIEIFKGIFPDDKSYSLRRESIIWKIKHASESQLKAMLVVAKCDIADYMSSTVDDDGNPTSFFNSQQAIDDLVAIECENIEREGVISNYKNPIFVEITNSINKYLESNKSVNDFYLMKDIVDRNCDSKEEEISIQTPIPLYLGLVGTMSGVLVGVAFLWLTGGLSDLLGSGGNGSGAKGIEALLGGVALAMISSILGIVLTTISSNSFKKAKSIFEVNKHTFLSWIQAKLMPKLSDNVVGAIRDMTGNLTNFNDVFSNNVRNLDVALGKINSSYKQQTELMAAVRKLADKDLSMKNLKLFEALTHSTKEIEELNRYLVNSNEYIANVKALNENLEKHENRTRIMEEIGVFFKSELTQIEERKNEMSKAVGKVDDYLKQVLDNLKDNAEKQFVELQKTVGKQDELFKKKSDEIENIVSGMRDFAHIKDNMAKFTAEIHSQNDKFDKLIDLLKVSATAKRNSDETNGSQPESKKEKHRPLWSRIVIPVVSVVVGLILICLLVANIEFVLSFIQQNFMF